MENVITILQQIEKEYQVKVLYACETGNHAERKINVYRKDREFLLSIKEGKYGYDELVAKAETLKNELPSLDKQSSLPEMPDVENIDKLLIEMRKEYYGEN